MAKGKASARVTVTVGSASIEGKSGESRRGCLSKGVGSKRQVSPGQIRISVLQLCILITVPQLTLHTGIATLVLRILFHRALAAILISRFVHGGFLASLNYSTLERQPISYTFVWETLSAAAARAGVGHISSHSFRHTYRSWLDSTGTPIVQQKLMRHSDVRTTLNIYGTAFTADMRQAHEKIVKLALTDRKVDREVAN
jgi:Phage integrase family